jgi:hypothetical protein
MTEFVSDGRQNRAMALLCFVASDTDGQIISGAALDLAMVIPAEKDPLAGPKLVAMHSCGGLRAMTGGEPSADEGHAAAGLLLLGDARLLPMLKDIWGRLSTEGRNNMIKRRGSLTYKATIEFLLQRLEEDKHEVHFGELGAFLHDLAGISVSGTHGLVLDAKRNFGLPTGKEPMELISRQTVGEVYREIKPRLDNLIAVESVPKVLPNVLKRWAEFAGENVNQTSTADSHLACVARATTSTEDDTFCISEELEEEFRRNIEPELDEGNADSLVSIWLSPYSSHSHITANEISDELPAGLFFPLLLTGQFNPLGPTITCHVVRRDALDEWTIWAYVLNPFVCSTTWVAALDNTKLCLEVGVFDQQVASRGKSLVFKGRMAKDAGALLDLLVNGLFARSRSQPGFTLCHTTRWVEEKAAFDLVFALHKSKKNGAQDTDWLREERTRADPWSRLDPESAMRLASGQSKKGRALTTSDALEFATRALWHEQQQIELRNILVAWDGAISMAGSRPVVLDRKGLMRILVNFSTDMPGLLDLEKEDKSLGAGTKTQRVPTASDPKPAALSTQQAATQHIAGPQVARNPTELAPWPKENKEPNFTGLTALVFNVSVLEVTLTLVAIIWSLVTHNWLLAGAMLVFGFLNMAKAGLMHDGHVSTRWWGVSLYVSMGAIDLYRLNFLLKNHGMTDASILLHQSIFWWMAVMTVLHILCFDFAKQVGAVKKS